VDRLYWANLRAQVIRAAFDRYLAREPEKAREYVNAKLAEASRLEEQRAIVHQTV